MRTVETAQKVVDLLQSSYDKLWVDIIQGKLTAEQLKEKHAAMVADTKLTIEEIIEDEPEEIVIPDILIVTEGGYVTEVHSIYDSLNYSVLDLDLIDGEEDMVYGTDGQYDPEDYEVYLNGLIADHIIESEEETL